MDSIELIDELVRRADEYQKQKEKEFAIAELEKIKTEILGQKMFYTPDIDIIDNHIKELKGENNNA